MQSLISIYMVAKTVKSVPELKFSIPPHIPVSNAQEQLGRLRGLSDLTVMSTPVFEAIALARIQLDHIPEGLGQLKERDRRYMLWLFQNPTALDHTRPRFTHAHTTM
jgi:hypothetical protein